MKVLCLLYCLLSTCALAKTITIYGDRQEKPKIFSSENGPAGILVDILKYIEKNSDLKFNVVLTPWARAYSSALDKKGGIIGLSKNKERLEFFDYTDVVFMEEIILVGRKGHKKFVGLRGLKGDSIAVTRGSIYGDEFEELRKKQYFKIIEVNNATQRIGMLYKNRIDWAIIGSGLAGLNSILDKDPELATFAARGLFVVKRPILVDPNFIGFHKSMRMGSAIKKINSILRNKYHQQNIIKLFEKNIYQIDQHRD